MSKDILGKIVGIAVCLTCLIPYEGKAELRPEKVFVADTKKTQAYIKEGLITGGDRAIENVKIEGIRRGSTNSGFERIVIDLKGNRNGNPTVLKRPPYYQMGISPAQKRLTLSIWGKPSLSFNAKGVLAAFKKSQVVSKVVLLPRLEEDAWTFAVDLNSSPSVEVFELTNPVRIIMDIQRKKSSEL